MGKAHVVTTKIVLNGAELGAVADTNRTHKIAAIRQCMRLVDDMEIKGSVEIHQTESQAKAWAVYSYKVGDEKAIRTGAVQK